MKTAHRLIDLVYFQIYENDNTQHTQL